MVEIDNLGRLLVPKDLIVFASLTKDLVLSSATNSIEIWDKEAYEKTVNDDSIDFGALAEEVMGSINFNENGIS